MLTVTADAARAIRRLTDEHHAGGLRISSVANSADDGSVSLSVSLVTDSEPGDQVVSEEGAQVFIQDRVAPLLDDKALDTAGPEDQKTVEFRITNTSD